MRIHLLRIATALLLLLLAGGAGGLSVLAQGQDQADRSPAIKQDEKTEQDPDKKDQDEKPKTDKPQEEKPDEKKPQEPEPQEDPDQPSEEGTSDFPRFSLDASYSLWIGDFDFSSQTATETREISEGSIMGLDLAGRYDFSESWGVRAGLEFGFGADMDLVAGSVSGVYHPDLLEAPWDLSVRAGFVFGSLDVDSVPGDFDPGFGVEGAGTMAYELSESFSLQGELGLRFLEFEFDEDGGVTDADSEVGGFGVRFLLGVEYRF